LIVEDDEFIRILTKTVLVQLGFEVKDVGDGSLAVQACEE
jgi:CheY-like chemotaxis protein